MLVVSEFFAQEKVIPQYLALIVYDLVDPVVFEKVGVRFTLMMLLVV